MVEVEIPGSLSLIANGHHGGGIRQTDEPFAKQSIKNFVGTGLGMLLIGRSQV